MNRVADASVIISLPYARSGTYRDRGRSDREHHGGSAVSEAPVSGYENDRRRRRLPRDEDRGPLPLARGPRLT